MEAGKELGAYLYFDISLVLCCLVFVSNRSHQCHHTGRHAYMLSFILFYELKKDSP